MFKFNFSSENHEDNVDDIETANLDIAFLESKEILYDDSASPLKNDLNCIKTKLLNTNNLEIKYVCSESLIEILRKTPKLNEDSILKAEQNHSDLLPAIYEGGLKIWECTYDLLNYFSENQITFKEKTVLDLGCGAGILGLVSLLAGGCSWFQDYNVDVIHNITIPNVLLNCEKNIDNCKFFSGDWRSFVQLIEDNYPNQKFDYIVTSETIYNTSYYSKLHLVFEKLLKRDGVINLYTIVYSSVRKTHGFKWVIQQLYLKSGFFKLRFLAAKSFYFGVGGGIHLFQNFLDNKKILKYKNCWQSTEGVKREILRLEFL